MFSIQAFQLEHLGALKEFTDKAIGTDYYTLPELEEIHKKSQLNNRIFTLLLTDLENNIHGVRITYPQGNWKSGKGKGLNPNLWGVPMESVAYFQSLYIAMELTGQGWGKTMSLEAIRMLKESGTKAIVTHSWMESPNASSGKYLRGLGFKSIAIHPLYWNQVDYVCTRCGKPCVCTAEEMLLVL